MEVESDSSSGEGRGARPAGVRARAGVDRSALCCPIQNANAMLRDPATSRAPPRRVSRLKKAPMAMTTPKIPARSMARTGSHSGFIGIGAPPGLSSGLLGQRLQPQIRKVPLVALAVQLPVFETSRSSQLARVVGVPDPLGSRGLRARNGGLVPPLPPHDAMRIARLDEEGP